MQDKNGKIQENHQNHNWNNTFEYQTMGKMNILMYQDNQNRGGFEMNNKQKK